MKFIIVLVVATVVAVQAQDVNYELIGNSIEPQEKVKTKPIVGVEPSIIGGTAVTQGQFSWMVAIIIDFSKFCAGTLITNVYILTAAHCTYKYNFFELYMGSVDYTNINVRISYTTSTKYVHQSFNSSTMNNDIALLKVSDIYSGYFTSGQISLIRLPRLSQENYDFAGSQAKATGWGKVSDTSSISPTMNAVNLQVITNTECKKYFSSKYIISSTLCAYGSGTKAICSGDSGGPLHVTESDGKYTQIAINSFTSSYSCLTYPNGFVRVMAFKSWIISTTNNTYTFRS